MSLRRQAGFSKQSFRKIKSPKVRSSKIAKFEKIYMSTGFLNEKIPSGNGLESKYGFYPAERFSKTINGA